MPKTYVVHLGNSKELMEVAEDTVAKRVLREHVRESLGVQNEDILFAIINSMHSTLVYLLLVLFNYATILYGDSFFYLWTSQVSETCF